MSAKISTRSPLTDIDDLDDFEIRDNSETPNNDVQNKKVSYGIVKGILAHKQPVRAATTVNGTLATAFENGDTIDGVSLVTGDRILLKDQSTGSENGIYTVNSSGVPTRAIDFDTTNKVKGSMAVGVQEGTINADTFWQLTNNGTITIDTTDLVFSRFGDAIIGTHQWGFDAGGMYIGTTTPAQAPAVREIGANNEPAHFIEFLDGADSIAYLDWYPPENWDPSIALKVTLYWTTEEGASSETIEIEVSGVARGNDDPIGGAAYGTAVAVTDTWIANDDEHVTSQFTLNALGGTAAKGKKVNLKFLRDISADTLSGGVEVTGGIIEYAIDKAQSSG